MRFSIDKDVAEIYGVQTKRINEAVKNNSDKFPSEYLFEISNEEFKILRSKFSTTKFANQRKRNNYRTKFCSIKV